MTLVVLAVCRDGPVMGSDKNRKLFHHLNADDGAVFKVRATKKIAYVRSLSLLIGAAGDGQIPDDGNFADSLTANKWLSREIQRYLEQDDEITASNLLLRIETRLNVLYCPGTVLLSCHVDHQDCSISVQLRIGDEGHFATLFNSPLEIIDHCFLHCIGSGASLHNAIFSLPGGSLHQIRTRVSNFFFGAAIAISPAMFDRIVSVRQGFSESNSQRECLKLVRESIEIVSDLHIIAGHDEVGGMTDVKGFRIV